MAGRSSLEGVRRLLVVRLDNIGDIVLLGPAVRTLKRQLPGINLTLLASAAGAQAVPLLPEVDEVIVTRPIWQEVGATDFYPDDDWKLIERLHNEAFDAALIFTSFSQSPHAPAAACALAGIPLRAGSSRERGSGALTIELPSPPLDCHQAERNLAVLEGLGLDVEDRLPALPPRLFGEGSIDEPGERRERVVVSPWASCQARTYAPERMVEAAARVAAERGWQVYVVGRSTERSRLPSLLSGLAPALRRQVVEVVGQTSVAGLARLITSARLVFSNNSLVLHLADAARVPAIVTYAGTDLLTQWAPRASFSRLLQNQVDCSPCYLLTCPYGHECLDLPVERVMTAAEELLTEVGL